jgi:uncharacterized protein
MRSFTFLKSVGAGVRLRIHVQPNASKNQIVGLHGEALKIKVAAPPEDGRANAELCEFLAETLAIAKSRVTVVSGLSSRAKQLEIANISLDHVEKALKLILQS